MNASSAQIAPQAGGTLRLAQILEATTGGTRRHLVDLVTGLPADRFSQHVICSTRRDKAFLDDIPRLKACGVRVTVLPMVRAIRPWLDALGCCRIYLELRRRPVDIVHTHSSKAGILGRLAARAAGIPAVVHTSHVFPFQMDVGRAARSLYRAMERLAAPFTDRFICVSRHEREAALHLGLAPEERFVVIENGVAPREADPEAGRTVRAEWGAGSGDVVVLLLGRFSRQKGHEDLVHAAARLAGRDPPIRFVMVGNGELEPRIRGMVRGQGLDRVCATRDAVSNLAGIHEAADIVVLPSLWEGMPYTLLDAMAAGKAIVATSVGGMSEVVRHRETGLLVPPKNPAALAEAIGILAADPGMRRALGARARTHVTGNFRLDRMLTRTCELYEAVSRRTGTPTPQNAGG